MPAAAMRHRRPIAVALIAAAVLALALVAAALWNPWRFTALYPLARAAGAVTLLTLAGAMLAAAAILALGGAGRRALVGLLVSLVAVPALCVGAPALTLGDLFRGREPVATLMATSPGGGYSVVRLTVIDDANRTFLYVRSRRLLLSREAATPLAECPRDPFSNDLPPESVRFTDETTVALPVQGASSVTVRFNPASLEPERTVRLCG